MDSQSSQPINSLSSPSSLTWKLPTNRRAGVTNAGLSSALLCLCSPFLWMEAGGGTCSPLKGALCWRERQPPRPLIRPRIISVEAPVPPGVQFLEKSFPCSSPSPVPLHFILRVRAGFPVPQAQWWGWMGIEHQLSDWHSMLVDREIS